MGEKKGLIFTMFILAVFLLPLGIEIFKVNMVTEHFTKATNQVTQLIKVEGGKTKKVEEMVGNLTIGGGKGNTLLVTTNYSGDDTGKADVGSTITINYSYEHDLTFYATTTMTLTSSTTIAIDKR